MQQIIIQNLHLQKNSMKPNMDVHAHALNKIICQGTNVLYSWRKIMISQMSMCILNCWRDTGKETTKNLYVKNVMTTWNMDSKFNQMKYKTKWWQCAYVVII